MYRAVKEAGIALLALGDILCSLGLRIFISACSGWKRKDFCSVNPFYQEANKFPDRLGELMSKRRFNAIFANTNPPP